jgi:hypothetical protein
MRNYKKGDVVICLPGFHSDHSREFFEDYGGGKYQEGKVFTVNYVSFVRGDGKGQLLQALGDGYYGVYSHAVELYVEKDNYQIY